MLLQPMMDDQFDHGDFSKVAKPEDDAALDFPAHLLQV